MNKLTAMQAEELNAVDGETFHRCNEERLDAIAEKNRLARINADLLAALEILVESCTPVHGDTPRTPHLNKLADCGCVYHAEQGILCSHDIALILAESFTPYHDLLRAIEQGQLSYAQVAEVIKFDLLEGVRGESLKLEG